MKSTFFPLTHPPNPKKDKVTIEICLPDRPTHKVYIVHFDYFFYFAPFPLIPIFFVFVYFVTFFTNCLLWCCTLGLNRGQRDITSISSFLQCYIYMFGVCYADILYIISIEEEKEKQCYRIIILWI